MRKLLPSLVLVLAGAKLVSALETRTVLVFPFENQSGRPDLAWISESFSDVISSRLASPANYVLDRESRNAAYARLEIPAGTPLTMATKFKLAQALGADWAVVGEFNVEGDRLTARGQLLELRRLKLAPALEETGELAELVDLESRLAWRLLAVHDPGFTVGKEEDFERGFPQIRLDAYENYIRGVLSLDEEARIHYLSEANRLNPADRRAASELGRLYFGRKDYAESAAWFSKVVGGEGVDPEALFLLGVDDFFVGREAEAEQAFAKLASRAPLPEVENNLAVMLARRGRYAEALAGFERAFQGRANDFDFAFNLGVCLWYLDRYTESATRLAEAARLTEDDPAPHALLAVVYGKLGNEDGRRIELQWLAEHEGAAMAEPSEEILPQVRMKKQYDARALRGRWAASGTEKKTP